MAERHPDQLLVERVQQGDKRAFDLLVKKYQHKVLAVIGRFVRDPDLSMDVAQDAFVKAYRALDRFRGDSAFYTWIYRIAVNTAKNHLVSKGRRPPDTDVEVSDAEYYSGGDALRESAKDKSEDERKTVEEAVGKLKEALAGNDSEAINSANEAVMEAWSKASAELYKDAGPPPGEEAGTEEAAAGGEAEPDEEGKGGEDVVDADYEVVDDDKEDDDKDDDEKAKS